MILFYKIIIINRIEEHVTTKTKMSKHKFIAGITNLEFTIDFRPIQNKRQSATS